MQKSEIIYIEFAKSTHIINFFQQLRLPHQLPKINILPPDPLLPKRTHEPVDSRAAATAASNEI